MPRAAAISSRERARALDALESQRFDLALIGGGITGAGIALEAARRGLAVALLEADDFASGTSGRSSKLIHGGLRYLAMGDVGLVREASLERKAIHRIAPHLAEPRWMVLPTRGRAGLARFRVGIATYERLGSVEPDDRHRSWGRAELEREEPLLDRDRYPHACAYREYLTDDARLVLANLRGAAARGAVALNHAPAVGLRRDGERISAVVARCAATGREVAVRARAVVNAAGPWVEAVRRLEWRDAPAWLHLSKGIHISVPAGRLPLRNLVMAQASDGRTVFCIRRGGVTYVGTTDTTYEPGAELWPRITAADVEYLLEPLPRYFRVEPLKLDDVVGAWAGLRPLIAQGGKAPAEISRRDEIFVGPGGLISIAGGKLTAYRAMARTVLRKIEDALGETLPEPDPDDVLPGGDFDGDLDALAARLDAPPRLARLYGAEAAAVLERGADALEESGAILCGEVDWAVLEEGALRLEDVLYRRNRCAVWSPLAAPAALEPVARRMAALLDWSEDRVASEVESARARLGADLAFAKSDT